MKKKNMARTIPDKFSCENLKKRVCFNDTERVCWPKVLKSIAVTTVDIKASMLKSWNLDESMKRIWRSNRPGNCQEVTTAEALKQNARINTKTVVQS